MIYTLTLNPAIDYVVHLAHLVLGETNRMQKQLIKPGGKGINVSKILKNLGMDTTAVALVAGFTGDKLRDLVEKDGIKTDFISLENGFTRINVKIKAKEETEINGQGPKITQAEKEQLIRKLDRIQDSDLLFLSGSVPDALGVNFYAEIMEHLLDKDVKIIVDGEKDALKNTLAYKPYLIKPNKRELEGLFDVKIKDEKDIKTYGKKLMDLGAINVIVSLGGDGAYFISQSGREYLLDAPKGKVIDTVGSGDSMLAGFVYGKLKGYDDEKAFRFSLACGSATAFSQEIATNDEIINLYEKMGGTDEY